MPLNLGSRISMSNSQDLMCVSCPNPNVYDTITEALTIYCLHSDSWYEIVYLKQSKQYLIYKLTHHFVIDTGYARESTSTQRELIAQLESEKNITPNNAKEKLLTILTFS